MRRPAGFLLLALLALALFATLTSATVYDARTCGDAKSGTCIRIGVPRCPKCSIVGYEAMINWYVSRVNNGMGGKFTITDPSTGTSNQIPVAFVDITLSGNSATAAEILNAVNTTWLGGGVPGQKHIDFAILPVGSNWANAMVMLEKAHVPAIASNSPLSTLYQCPATGWRSVAGCSGSGARRFQYAHGISNAGEQFFQAWVGLLKLKKAQTVAVVQTNVALYQSIYNGVLTAAADYSMKVTYQATAPFQVVGGVTSTSVDPQAIEDIITKLQGIDPDGLVLSAQNCVPWIQAFARRDYAPRSLATVLCTDTATTVGALGDLLKYVAGSAQWNPLMNGNDYVEDSANPWSFFPKRQNKDGSITTSPTVFQNVWRNVTNSPESVSPGYSEAATLAGFQMLEGAIQLSVNPDPDLVNTQLQLYYQPSYFGLISTNRYGINQQKQLVINQRDTSNTLGIVSPQSAATLDFVYPMPVFSVRTYKQVMLGTPVEYIVIAVMCLCLAFTLSLCVYLFAKRNNQVFQAAGLPFYLMMGFGCCVAFVSVLSWGVENNVHSCRARIWVWTIGFHMFVDPLLASSWRIGRIFSQKLQTVKLTNRMVAGVCLIIFAPQLLINLLWMELAPLEPKVVTTAPLTPAHTSFTTCSGGDAGVIFTGITLAYSGLMLVSACYLAYRVRKAYRMFNDAKPIAMSMYIFTVTAAIILVIQVALNTDDVSAQKVLFGLRSIGVMIAYQSSLSLLYFRRILGQAPDAVNKYGQKSSIDDTTSTHGTGANIKNARVGADGKLVWTKSSAHAAGATGGTPMQTSRGDSRGAHNVHVHIQPPMGTDGTATPTDGGGLASPSLGTYPAVRISGRMPGASPNRSPQVGSGNASPAQVNMSSLALGDLSNTPKFGPKGGAGSGLRLPIGHGIVTLPPTIPLPSQQELLQMDPAQLITLVQQFHAQNQVLRSQIRAQNLQTAAVARGELVAPGGIGIMNTSLPGTPDRSPRNDIDGPVHRHSFLAQTTRPPPSVESDKRVLLQQSLGAPSSEAEMIAPPGTTRQNSNIEASEATASRLAASAVDRDHSGDSNAGPEGVHHAHHNTVTAQLVHVDASTSGGTSVVAEISPVSEIKPGSLQAE